MVDMMLMQRNQDTAEEYARINGTGKSTEKQYCGLCGCLKKRTLRKTQELCTQGIGSYKHMQIMAKN
jgi:hypothetical protein